MKPYRFMQRLIRVGCFSGLAILCGTFFSCTTDFIEPNLENKNMYLLSPPDHFHSAALTNTFWWDEVKGATKYRLQIVDSSFVQVNSLILDSAVTETQFPVTLSAGTYQWRVRAENGSSHSDYSAVRTLYIDSTPNLAQQVVVLLSPSSNAYSNSVSTSFKWDAIPFATDYRFKLTDLSNGSLITDVIVSVDSFNYTLTPGNFQWQVRAQNATSNSPYSSRVLNIDITPPGPPVINSPADGATIANPVALSWTHDTGAIGDSLYVYADSLFVTTLANVYTLNSAYNYTGSSGQHYFWRVKSVDNAGNWGAFSTLRKFYVQ